MIVKSCQDVGNKAIGRISKRVFQENKARQIFRKTNISHPLIRIRAPVLRFAILPYYWRRVITWIRLKWVKWNNLFRTEPSKICIIHSQKILNIVCLNRLYLVYRLYLNRLYITLPILECFVSNACSTEDHLFSAYGKFFEKLTFLTAWYADVRCNMRIRRNVWLRCL